MESKEEELGMVVQGEHQKVCIDLDNIQMVEIVVVMMVEIVVEMKEVL